MRRAAGDGANLRVKPAIDGMGNVRALPRNNGVRGVVAIVFSLSEGRGRRLSWRLPEARRRRSNQRHRQFADGHGGQLVAGTYSEHDAR